MVVLDSPLESAMAPRHIMESSALRCSSYAVGIIGSLLTYGLLQERLMSVPYDTELFTVSVFLVFCNRVVAVGFAFVMSVVHGESLRSNAPLWKYLAISLSNVGASFCQYEALRYVSFPVQMLGKSFKMMPVMVWGIIISNKAYTVTDWLIAAAVTGGVTEFLLTGNIAASHQQGTSMKGMILLVVFLGLDGFTSTFQEKLFKEHKTSKFNQMLYVNAFSAVVSFITLLATKQLSAALGFCTRHPVIVQDIVVLSASAVSGQWFIYSQLKEFGALVLAATMNARQVISIMMSLSTYNHQVSNLQILGLVMVFAGLLYKSCACVMTERAKKSKEQAPLLAKDEKLASRIDNRSQDAAKSV